MANPTLYRKKSLHDIHNRNLITVSESERTSVSNTINKFFELFVLRHLS